MNFDPRGQLSGAQNQRGIGVFGSFIKELIPGECGPILEAAKKTFGLNFLKNKNAVPCPFTMPNP